jgi:hypothetical protein
MLELNRKEILRYLGYRGNQPDETVSATIESAIEELERVMTPKSVTCPVTIRPAGENTLDINGMIIESKSLSQHLDSCQEGVLFAATLGAPVDMLIQRYNVLDMSRAVILQSCAATAVEAYCDQCQDEIEAMAREKGLYLRPRYSPGYGDFPLTYQKEVLSLLNAQRRIGLTRTDGDILVPTKSVTAVIGFTTESTSCHVARCMTCTAKNCPFRKES